MDTPDGWLIRAGGMGPNAAAADWWDEWRAALEKAWSTQASIAFATRELAAIVTLVPEDEADPSRPAAPALPTDVWILIMDRAPSCRCGRAELAAPARLPCSCPSPE